MGPSDESTIEAWCAALTTDLAFGLILTGDRRSERFVEFGDLFRRVGARVDVQTRRVATAEPPAVLVGRVLRFHSAAHGTELQPFLEAVGRFGGQPPPVDQVPASEAGRASDFRLYVSPHCSFCPVATVNLLSAVDEATPLTVIDAELFPELAERDFVRSVPTVLVGRHFRASGAVSLDDVCTALVKPAGALARSTLEQLLGQGDAEAVAAMMAAQAAVDPALLDLLASPTMSVRLGAMAALARLVEISPDVAGSVEPDLWNRFEGAASLVQGDLLYMIGEVAGMASLPRLEAVAASAGDKDVAEAARDAVARIVERFRTSA